MTRSTKVLVLSRGHGFGHAARDWLFIESLDCSPEMVVEIASSGLGYEFYRSRGRHCAQLDIPDAHDMDNRAGNVLLDYLRTKTDADVVIADEVIWAPAICNRLGIPCVYVSNWLFSEVGRPEKDRILDDAAAVVIPDFPAAHPGAVNLPGPVHLVGPLVRDFRSARRAARKSLGAGERETVVVIAASGVIRPEFSNFARSLLDYVTVSAHGDHRFYVFGDYSAAHHHADRRAANVSWIGRTDSPQTYLAAADVAVVDAKGTTMSECVRNEIATIGVVPGYLNGSDKARIDLLAEHGSVHLATGAETREESWALVEAARAEPTSRSLPPLRWGDPATVGRLMTTYAKSR